MSGSRSRRGANLRRPEPWGRVIPRRLALIALCAVASLSLAGGGAAIAGGGPAPRVQCDQPARLKLQRFEDGSAKLWCGRRLLLRVGVPW